MGLFRKQPAPIPFDDQRHERVDVNGQDATGERPHEYIRDRNTQRIIGKPAPDGRVQPFEKPGRKWS